MIDFDASGGIIIISEAIILKKILLILTGGTICSVENEDGKRQTNAESAKYKIISEFRKSDSPFKNADFDIRMPVDTLSENMTFEKLNLLLDELRKVNSEDYSGIIILHGTDTLAYTASLLSLVMSEKKLPVCLVSSHSPIDSIGTNANINFRAAVELIMNGIKPNVYAVYQNSDGKTYVHFGSQLLQCGNYSNDFYSADAAVIESEENAKLDGTEFETDSGLLTKLGKLSANVLFITPVTGLDYSSYNLSNVSAVVHKTYHSQTVCVEGGRNSFVEFSEKCKKEGVSLILTPCDKKAYSYVTTGVALKSGAFPVSGMTDEMVYIKTVVGCSLGYKGNELNKFLNTSINLESVY